MAAFDAEIFFKLKNETTIANEVSSGALDIKWWVDTQGMSFHIWGTSKRKPATL